MIKVIGLSGLIGSGKTTAALALVDRLGYTRERFAEPLKAMMAALGLSQDDIDGPTKELPSALLCGKTPRHAMQTIGMEWGRQCIGPDIWVNAWARKAAQHALVVADDVRFPNEAAMIKSLGGVVIKIIRAGQWQDPHPSEAGVASDMTIMNDQSIALLQGTVCEIAENGQMSWL